MFNHITAKVPGADDQFLINNFGLRYDEITASNMIKVDLKENVVGGNIYGQDTGQLDAIAKGIPEAQFAITPEGLNKLPYAALIRELDQTDPDYRTSIK